jgi:hypothetical protein
MLSPIMPIILADTARIRRALEDGAVAVRR